jgi:hypothetical protein
LDVPEDWTYTSRSGAAGKVGTTPKLKRAVMLVGDYEELGDESMSPSVKDMAAWLGKTLPSGCDLTAKFEPLLLFNIPSPWCLRWMEDVEKIYRSHRTG